MTKTLKQLIQAIDTLKIVGDEQVTISGITCDSREASQGALFIAVKGVAVDAHRFIPDVIAKGAAAIVCQDLPDEQPQGVTFVHSAKRRQSVVQNR